MISRESLNEGSWYVGFIWKSGKQQGVESMVWRDDAFWADHLPAGPYEHFDGAAKDFMFEPNAVTTEPATKVWCKACENHVGDDDDCVLNNLHCGHPNARRDNE
jgi:hypothetical protein